MLKKAMFVAVGLVGLGILIANTSATSYLRTSAGWVKDSVKNSVPLEFEIERARQMITDILPDIRKNMHLIAKEEVEVERLEQQIDETQGRLETDRTDLMRLRTDLATGGSVFHYAGRKYSADQVKTDLANRFERFKTNEATVASLQEMHDARTSSLESARTKLEKMLAAKRQLEVDVEHLEARLKMVDAAQTASTYQFDDSRLSRCQKLIDDVRTRLDVAERLVHSEGYYQGQIPLNESGPENIVDEVAEYFHLDAPAANLASAEVTAAE